MSRLEIKEKGKFTGAVTGINDAIYIKNKYEFELDRSWKLIVDMVHYLEEKNKELKQNKTKAESLRHDIESYNEKRSTLYNSLNNLLEKEKSHEYKMWLETQKKQKVTNLKVKQKFKDSDIDEINYNSMLQYIRQYPEYQTKSTFKRVIENIEQTEEGIRQKKKEYNKVIGDYNSNYSILLKDIIKAEDKIVAYNDIMKEGQEKLDNCRYNKSLFYKLGSEKNKELTKIDNLSHRVVQFKNTLEIIKKEHAKNQIKELVEMEY